MSLLAATAVLLVPVGISSPELEAETTFISQDAQALIAAQSVEVIKCLDIGEQRDGTDRVCLSAPEWQAVFEKARFNAGAERRERAIARAQYNAGR